MPSYRLLRGSCITATGEKSGVAGVAECSRFNRDAGRFRLGVEPVTVTGDLHPELLNSCNFSENSELRRLRVSSQIVHALARGSLLTSSYRLLMSGSRRPGLTDRSDFDHSVLDQPVQ